MKITAFIILGTTYVSTLLATNLNAYIAIYKVKNHKNMYKLSIFRSVYCVLYL